MINPKLVNGCNYHTTWQSIPGMRFVLVSFNDRMAVLRTRTTHKVFTTLIENLIFIESDHNIRKAERLGVCGGDFNIKIRE
jgi:hypothetical protein